MRVFIQTRGRSIDYSFLGEYPEERWWSTYRNVTAFEDPTILVQSDGSSWKACLSGIPSSRKDRVGTTIRYTLVLDGETSVNQSCSPALVVVAAWLDDVALARPQGYLQRVLDSEFPEDFVESVMADRDTTLSIGRVAAKLVQAIAKLPSLPDLGEISTSTSWVGALEQTRPREAFLRQVKDLLGGKVGRALLVNLVGSVTEAQSIVNQGTPAAVLILDSNKFLGTGIVPLEEKKKTRHQSAI